MTGGRQERKQTSKRSYSCNGVFRRIVRLRNVVILWRPQVQNNHLRRTRLPRIVRGMLCNRRKTRRRDLIAAEREESIVKAAVTTNVLQGELGAKKINESGGPQKSVTVVPAAEEAPSTTDCMVTVKVLKAAKVPGRHCQLVKVNALMQDNKICCLTRWDWINK